MSIISDANNSPIAGEDYALECYAAGSVVAFNWLGPPDGMTPIIIVNGSLYVQSNSSTSWLHFSPIQQSHNGLYSCVSVSDEGRSRLLSEPIEISVNGKINCNCITVIFIITCFAFAVYN